MQPSCHEYQMFLFDSMNSINRLQQHYVSPLDNVKPAAQNL